MKLLRTTLMIMGWSQISYGVNTGRQTRQATLIPSKADMESTIGVFEDIAHQTFALFGASLPKHVADAFTTIHAIIDETITDGTLPLPVADGTLPLPGTDEDVANLIDGFTSFLCKLIVCPAGQDTASTSTLKARSPRAAPAMERRADYHSDMDVADDALWAGIADGSITITPVPLPQVSPADIEALLPVLLEAVRDWRHLISGGATDISNVDVQSEGKIVMRAPIAQVPAAPTPAPAPAAESGASVEVSVKINVSEGAIGTIASAFGRIVDGLRGKKLPKVKDEKAGSGQ